MSFRLKTILGIALIEAIFLSIIVWSSISYLRTSSLEDISFQAESINSLFASAVKDAVISRDLDSLVSAVNNLLEDKGVVYVRIYHRSELILSSGDLMYLSASFIEDEKGVFPEDGIYDTSTQILEAGYNFGRVELGFDTGPINERVVKSSSDITIIALLELLFCGLFSWGLGVYLTKYLTLLKDGSKELARGNLGYQIPVKSDDELADVAMAFNHMSNKVSSLLNISEIQKVKIREREFLLNEILQGMPFGVLLGDSKSKKVVFYNNEFFKLLSSNQNDCSDYMGMSFIQVMSVVKQCFVDSKSLEDFSYEAVNNDSPLKSPELELVNGSFIEIEFFPLKLKDDGVVYYLVIFLDVTERKDVEREIRQSSNELTSVFNLNPDGLVQFDDDKVVIRVNAAFSLLTGLPSSKLVGRNLKWLDSCLKKRLTPESVIPDLGFEHFSGPVFGSITLQMDGAGLVHLDRIICFNENDVKLGGIVYYRNVTEQKKLELMKSEFLSTAAHELRTPMANIYGYSELLLNTDYSSDVQSELLEIIHKQSDRLVFILNDLLDLARIESKGSQDMSYEMVSLNELIVDCVKMFESDEGRVFNLYLDDIAIIKCDKNKIIQVVNNIISNALKYSPSGEAVDVSLKKCGCIGTDGPSIIVEDNGLGMSSEQLTRVFERFYRVDSSGNIPGTGLGMSIVKEIVDMHNGKIEIESKEGIGTKVTICLPYI